MSERERIAIPFGDGLDRGTGRMVGRPTSMTDLRNVLLYPGRVVFARGMKTISQIVDHVGDPVSHVLGGIPVPGEGTMILVVYQQQYGYVEVVRTTDQGTSPEVLSYIGLLPAGSPPPIYSLAESGGKVFMAHGQVLRRNRFVTCVYDPEALNLVSNLESLDDNGVAWGDGLLAFRGVAAWRAYMLGWGADNNRPDMIRYSLPGQPREFRADDYWAIGSRGEAITSVLPLSNEGVIVGKANCTWAARGLSATTAQILVLDEKHGIPYPRLLCEYRGGALYWGDTGPRWQPIDGPSVHLDLPLDLRGFEPSTLVAPGELRNGFCDVIPHLQLARFVFGKRVYQLHFVTPDDPKWSYRELGVEAHSGWLTMITELTGASGGGGGPGPGGEGDGPYATVGVDPEKVYDFSAVLGAYYVNVNGTEWLEVWIKKHTDGTWALARPVFKITETADEEYVRVGYPVSTPLAAYTQYDVAFRLRRGGSYTVGFEGTPDQWTHAAAESCKGTFTTKVTTRLVNTPAWSRVDQFTEKVVVTWYNGEPTVEYQYPMQIARCDTEDGVYTTLDTVVVCPEPDPDLGANWNDAGAGRFTDVLGGTDGEKRWYYKVRTDLGGGSYGAWSNIVTVWAGPPRPLGHIPGTLVAPGNYADGYGPCIGREELWERGQYEDQRNPYQDTMKAFFEVPGDPAGKTLQIEWDPQTNEAGFPKTDDFNVSCPQSWSVPQLNMTYDQPPPEGSTGSPGVKARMRLKLTAFTIDDYSEWTPVTEETV